jgi:uncharacterized protein (DUF1778 family)
MTNSDETIEIRLPKDTIFRMAMEAHRQGVSLNDYIIRVALKRAKEFDDILEIGAEGDKPNDNGLAIG